MVNNFESCSELAVSPAIFNEVKQDSKFGNGVIATIDGREPVAFPKLNEHSNEIAKDFLDSIKNHKTEIMGYYPNLKDYEYNEITKRAIGILYQETKAGEDGMYQGKEFIHDIADTISLIGGIRKGIGSSRGMDYSRGYTHIKFDDNFDDKDKTFLNTLGIKSENDLRDVEKCGIATMVALIKKYYEYIIPMKQDKFWLNDAKIIEVTCKDNKVDSFAIGKKVPQEDGTLKIRTNAEIEKKIENFGNNHGGIANKQEITRQGIKNDEFFDFLYFAWNKPSEIVYGTAIPEKSTYVQNCRGYVSTYINNN